MNNKIKNIEEIVKISEDLRKEGKIIVTTNGSFDILHPGHIDVLEKARKKGDILIVLINSDNSIRMNKGDKRPIIPENDRAIMLSALTCVNYVVIFNEEKPLNFLEKIKPRIHVKGGSFDSERIKEEKELLSKWNCKLETFDLVEGYSTTSIINKILEKYKE